MPKLNIEDEYDKREAQKREFWLAVRNMSTLELREVADLIHDSWEERECENTSDEFAVALAEYSDEWLEEDASNGVG